MGSKLAHQFGRMSCFVLSSRVGMVIYVKYQLQAGPSGKAKRDYYEVPLA
jgi:hypothetical protein